MIDIIPKEDEFLEKEVEADGRIYAVKYDLADEEPNSYWEAE